VHARKSLLILIFALNAYAEPRSHGDFQRLPDIVEEVASDTVEQVTQDLRLMAVDFANKPFDEFERVMGEKILQQSEVFERAVGNLVGSDNPSVQALAMSPEEAKLLAGLMLMAMRDQVEKGDSRGPLNKIALKIKTKLDAAAELTVEGRALKSLAKDSVAILKPSEKMKADFKVTTALMKDAFKSLTDKKLDGQGLNKFAKSMGAAARMVGEEMKADGKQALKPEQLARTAENGIVLANIANPDPATRAMIRNYMAYELGVQRMVFDDNGKLDVQRTMDRVAQRAPNDARAAIGALSGAGMIGPSETAAALDAVKNAELARKVVTDVSTFMKGNGRPPTREEVGRFLPQYIAGVASEMGNKDVARVFQGVSVVQSVPGAVEAGKTIYENSQHRRFDYEWAFGKKVSPVFEEVTRLPPIVMPADFKAPPLLGELPGRAKVR